MYIGNKNNINLTISHFPSFIENQCLYVDKTAFIEHVMQDSNDILLFTRPRRMGKSLNLNTLHAFLDFKQDTTHLFKGLYIERSPVYEEINQHPVVYLNFGRLDTTSYLNIQISFKRTVCELLTDLLKNSQLSPIVKNYINDINDYGGEILLSVLKEIYRVFGKKPILIIDEYDKPIMDTLDHTESEKIKKFVVTVLQSALKDNYNLTKAVLTGVTRTTKESLFSGLNNLAVYDVLKHSEYDNDFSLTHEEVTELVSPTTMPYIKAWYNNMRVGNSYLYNIYSVMCYLKYCGESQMPEGYWSMTGGEGLLKRLLNDERVQTITNMLLDLSERGTYTGYNTVLDYKLEMEHLKFGGRCSNISFYTLAVQAGYLSFIPNDDNKAYRVFIPNYEAWHVWSRIILDYNCLEARSELPDIFNDISNPDLFSERLGDFVSMLLSTHDIQNTAERIYHVFFLGMVHALGYECKSNLEAGNGRFDIVLRAKTFNAVLEFKHSKAYKDEKLLDKAQEALDQIDEKEYWREFGDSDLPIYKIGLACCGNKCKVKTVLHGDAPGLSKFSVIEF